MEARGTPTFKVQVGEEETVMEPKEESWPCAFSGKTQFLIVFI